MKILDLYKKALTIRCFEEKVDWLFSRGMLGGTTHLCIGQEAVAVGVCSALRPGDYVVSHHRGHGHMIARGGDLARMFSELLGNVEGYCGGRGGTQHMCAMELGFLGTNGITGGGIPIATGAGLSTKLSGSDRVSVCFFGDGASNQGSFHESMNMASVWDLPVLYVCENNSYAMSTRFSKVSRHEDVAVRAQAYGIAGIVVDGMDAVAVAEAASKAVKGIREGKGPVLLEAKTYRFCGHSKSDPRSYRTREEEALWKERDPLKVLEERLSRLIPADELASIMEGVKREVEEAYLKAEKGTPPDYKHSLEGVYAEKTDLVPQGNL